MEIILNTLLKKTAIATVLATSVLSLSACDHEVSVSENGAVVNANATDSAALNDKSSFEEKAAYAIGASLGEYVAQMKQSQEQLIGPISAEKVIEGFTDGVNGASALDRAQIEKVLKDLDAKIQEKIAQEQKISAEDNLKAGEAFLAANSNKDGVVTTTSGLQYKVVKQGEGETAKKGDKITVTYKGTTIDGVTFDESKKPIEFPLENMIEGWIEGLQLMNEGSEYILYIPSKLAYGENGASQIVKPNSVLIFDVQLLKIEKPASKAETESKEEAKK